MRAIYTVSNPNFYTKKTLIDIVESLGGKRCTRVCDLEVQYGSWATKYQVHLVSGEMADKLKIARYDGVHPESYHTTLVLALSAIHKIIRVRVGDGENVNVACTMYTTLVT